MRVYIKILSAIVVALVLLSLLATITLGVSGLSPTSETYYLPLAIAFIGFLIFGISGSILWLMFFMLLRQSSLSATVKHALAVAMATPASMLLLALLLYLESGETKDVWNTLGFFWWFVVPAAAVSVGCYWWLFLTDRYDAE